MACGIGERTLYEWLEKDPQFAQAIKEADAIAEARMVSRIIDAAKESWQAAAWWLERRRPDDYKRPDRVELLGSKSDPVRIEVVYVDEPIKQEHD